MSSGGPKTRIHREVMYAKMVSVVLSGISSASEANALEDEMQKYVVLDYLCGLVAVEHEVALHRLVEPYGYPYCCAYCWCVACPLSADPTRVDDGRDESHHTFGYAY